MKILKIVTVVLVLFLVGFLLDSTITKKETITTLIQEMREQPYKNQRYYILIVKDIHGVVYEVETDPQNFFDHKKGDRYILTIKRGFITNKPRYTE